MLSSDLTRGVVCGRVTSGRRSVRWHNLAVNIYLAARAENFGEM